MLGRESSRARHAGDIDRHPLTVDEVGDPGGTPVVYLHGGGDSRLTRHPDDSIARELGVRLLAVERCGPVDARRTLRSFADDVLAAVGVERFAVVGWSAGGPHALAVAAIAPERVTRVGLVASMPHPAALRHISQDVRAVMRVARVSHRAAATALERWGRKPVVATGAPETDEAYARGRVESFKHGGMWLAHELDYLGRPWGFELEQIETPVTLWWGRSDPMCKPPIADDYARRLPNATVRLVDGTHQMLFTHWREILADAAQQTRPSPPAAST